MATIEKFEDLQSWQENRKLCVMINEITSDIEFQNDVDLVRQIRRSAGSGMDNIAEGFERDGNREFVHFLTIAKASIGETRSQLYRAYDLGYISDVKFEGIKEQCILISKLIAGFIVYLNKSNLKGTKFKRR